ATHRDDARRLPGALDRRRAPDTPPQPTRSISARRMRNLPGSRTCSNAALLSRAQLPETEVTATVVDLLLSRLVTFSLVPIGNWLLEAAGAPSSPDSVTVEPAQTTSPLPALPLPAPPAPGLPTQPAALRRCWIRSTTACRLAIRAAEFASGFACWPAMKLKLLRSAVSSPWQDSAASLARVLRMNMPAASMTATPISDASCREVLMLRIPNTRAPLLQWPGPGSHAIWYAGHVNQVQTVMGPCQGPIRRGCAAPPPGSASRGSPPSSGR